MNEMNNVFHQIVDDYSQILLNWAYKKLGDKDKAEDLTQEVLLQVFAAIRKNTSDGIPIVKMDHFVWKIAHYAWCHYLRQNKHYKMCVPADDLQLEDDRDFAADFAENEYQKQLIHRMREKIVRLNFLQREIMIMFYIDGASINQIAKHYNIGESTVKWHLFDTRKKLKKEITTMEHNDFVYRPRKLHMGMNGQSCPNPDIKMIENGDKSIDTSGWNYNGSMCNDNYWWFGLYNFGKSEIEDMMDEYTAEWKNLHQMLCNIIHSDYDISAFDQNQKFDLTKLVQKGFVTIYEKKAFPNFCIFTSEKYQQLEETVFAPIAQKLEAEIILLANDLANLCKMKVPAQLKNYYNLFVRMALYDIGYLTTIFAFQDGRLYKPKDNHDGEFLTLMYIKR